MKDRAWRMRRLPALKSRFCRLVSIQFLDGERQDPDAGGCTHGVD